jgi:hypothetical protein
MALHWKELNAQKRHTEAMLILEEIITLSTPMFERLAQHEEYTNTVELSALVSAAQEKVIKWLLKWQPKKGRLFSWFSKSLTGDSRVLLADGSLKRIDEIVNKRLPVSVVTWDEESKAFTTRAVTDWIRSPAHKDGWRKVSVQHPSGFKRSLFATFDHEFQTQRGWIAVDSLRSTDQLYMRAPQLTSAGIEVVVGMYLGDGTISKKHAMVVGHGRKQKFYCDHLAEQFGKNVYDKDCLIKGKRYYSNSVCIPLRAVWPECKQLKQRKAITPFVLSHLSPIALAYWFMDDGSFDRKRGAVKLATDGFSCQECASLIALLQVKFGISAHYHMRKGKNYGYIYVLAESRPRFFEIVAPYVLEGFRYKMPICWSGPTEHPVLVSIQNVPCSFSVRPTVGYTNIRNGRAGHKKWFIPDFSTKYDITVPGTRNFVAESIVVHNCAKHAFLSELVKANQYRKRFHVTGDNLEKYYGLEDHASDKHNLTEEFDKSLKDLYCRWGSPQEIGAIRYLVECLVHDLDSHDKQSAIRAAAYAWGISMDLSKFFYSWALVALRDLHYKKIRLPFTTEDIIRHCYSYTNFVDLLDYMPSAELMRLIATKGGQRIKIPTIAQIKKLKDDHAIFVAVMDSDKDPDSIADIAKKRKRSQRTAQEAYMAMVEATNPNRTGEHEIFGNDEQ